jgi:hypothetical protein
LIDLGDPQDDSYVHCTRRSCGLQQIARYTPATAITAWNTRTAHSGEGRSNGAGEPYPGCYADLHRRRVTTLAKLGLMLTDMARGEVPDKDVYDPDELYAEVLMALAIEDAEDVEIALEEARDYPEGDCMSTLSAPQGEAVRGRAIDDITAERRRQVEAEGWTPEHDDEHGDGSLAAAAATYAFSAATAERYLAADPIGFWPWAPEWWKPSTPRRDLVKAGALIVAEIERIDRAALAQPEAGGER